MNLEVFLIGIHLLDKGLSGKMEEDARFAEQFEDPLLSFESGAKFPFRLGDALLEIQLHSVHSLRCMNESEGSGRMKKPPLHLNLPLVSNRPV